MGLFDDLTGVASGALKTAGDWLAKSDDDVSVTDMSEALIKAGVAEPTEEKPRGLYHDPFAVFDWGGWRQRPSALTYDTLRQMCSANTIIAAIIQLRVNQVGQFCRPQQGPYDKGYRIILRDRRDKNKAMTKAEMARATEIERMLETTGYLLPGEKPADRDSFRTFMKKFVRDTLTYDQANFELLRDRKARPSRFLMLPSETIRPAVADVEHMDPAERHSRVAYVQVYEDTIIAEFGPDDLAWCIMNPRSDLRVNTFGYAPAEQVIRLVTAWLFGFEANTKQFTNGSLIKGVINVKGAIPDRQLRAFRRMWYTMVSGVQNAWRTPILNSEDVQWLPMQMNNTEMQFGQWMDWLTKIISAVFGIDPVELNFIFNSGGRGGGASMFSSRPNQAETQESKDKGLRPLLDHIADCVNRNIVWDLEPDFEFTWAGFDAKAEEKEREARIAEVKAYKTLDQVRAELDDPPLPNGLGDVILDPTYLQWAMSKQQQQQPPPEEGGDDGELLTPGQEPGEGEEGMGEGGEGEEQEQPGEGEEE